MLKKRFAYSYEDYEDNDKSAETMVAEILVDPELAQIGSIEIGSWGNAWEDSCQAIIDGIVANKAAFAHVEELAIGIMDFEDCEISWIIQGRLFPPVAGAAWSQAFDHPGQHGTCAGRY